MSFTNSKLKNYILTNEREVISTGRDTYISVLRDIWKSEKSRNAIREKDTTFNFLPYKFKEKGYQFYEEIGYSYQGQDANGMIKEIKHMSVLNNYTMYMTITLESGDDVIISSHSSININAIAE